MIASFKHNDDGVEILIVVDKLLTGFDAPRNTVLYLAKELKDHNLLQAIVDWYRNNEVKRIIFNKLDDYLYDEVAVGQGVKLSNEEIKNIIDKAIKLGVENYQLF